MAGSAASIGLSRQATGQPPRRRRLLAPRGPAAGWTPSAGRVGRLTDSGPARVRAREAG
ncbi:hypothetical protein Rumeso_04119 [Rubellimicrobium mesophilum DSM 19309]|uniref:Uncharacterized protein n=1 Tax=Rubellimicrobium mesophilum DSM 19309 TaxID=442562 RepID=A0A017HJJ3_9RHOB|nr:hypothetical protein Rumeso_04119 [Rubellimicrobium mesophilum DSM 19309]